MKDSALTPKKNPVDIADAVAWTKKWQDDNKSHAKAFLIPIKDLLGCMTEMGLTITKDPVTGKYVSSDPNADLRAYMGIDVNDIANGFGEKLVIVGTVKNGTIHSDIVQGGTYPKAGVTLNGSGAYDITKPCPSDCDGLSPLFQK
jgi:hypothetical protein